MMDVDIIGVGDNSREYPLIFHIPINLECGYIFNNNKILLTPSGRVKYRIIDRISGDIVQEVDTADPQEAADVLADEESAAPGRQLYILQYDGKDKRWVQVDVESIDPIIWESAECTVSARGNSLGINIPSKTVRILGLEKGDIVEIRIRKLSD